MAKTSLSLWSPACTFPTPCPASRTFYGLLLLTILQENDHFSHFWGSTSVRQSPHERNHLMFRQIPSASSQQTKVLGKGRRNMPTYLFLPSWENMLHTKQLKTLSDRCVNSTRRCRHAPSAWDGAISPHKVFTTDIHVNLFYLFSTSFSAHQSL